MLGLRFLNSTPESGFKFVERGHRLRTERVGKEGICGSEVEAFEI